MFKTSLYLRAQLYVQNLLLNWLLIEDFCLRILFFLICDNNESKMGYVGGVKKARKSADGA